MSTKSSKHHHRSFSSSFLMKGPASLSSEASSPPSSSSLRYPSYSASSTSLSQILSSSRNRSTSSSGVFALPSPSSGDAARPFGELDFFRLASASTLPGDVSDGRDGRHWSYGTGMMRKEEGQYDSEDSSDDDGDLIVHLRGREAGPTPSSMPTSPAIGQSPALDESRREESMFSFIDSALSPIKTLALSTLALSPSLSSSLSLSSPSVSASPSLSPSPSRSYPPSPFLPSISLISSADSESPALSPSPSHSRWPTSPLAIIEEPSFASPAPSSPTADSSLPSSASTSSLKSAFGRSRSNSLGPGLNGCEEVREKKVVTFAVDVVMCEESDEDEAQSPADGSMSWRDWIGV